jgi:AraC family transcriptional regulator
MFIGAAENAMTHELDRPIRTLSFDAFSALVAAPFGLGEARAARIRIVARPKEQQELHLAAEPAYFVMLYLDAVDHCDLLASGEALPGRRYRRGSICVIDLSQGARIRLSSSLNALGFVIPFHTYEEARSAAMHPTPGLLRQRRNEGDAIVYRLGLSILPCFDTDPPGATPSLPYVIGALCAHLLDEPGSMLH